MLCYSALRYVVSPARRLKFSVFCVVGCPAVEHHQSFFRYILFWLIFNRRTGRRHIIFRRCVRNVRSYARRVISSWRERGFSRFWGDRRQFEDNSSRHGGRGLFWKNYLDSRDKISVLHPPSVVLTNNIRDTNRVSRKKRSSECCLENQLISKYQCHSQVFLVSAKNLPLTLVLHIYLHFWLWWSRMFT